MTWEFFLNKTGSLHAHLNGSCVSVPAVQPETPKVCFGYDRTPAFVRFNPNHCALADTMFEVMDHLGEVTTVLNSDAERMIDSNQ